MRTRTMRPAAVGISHALTRTLLVLVTLVAAFALAGCSRFRAPSDKGQVIFPHALHTEQADCGDCHGGIEKDTGGPAGKLIPGKAKCAECHEVKDQGKCGTCHRGAREGVRLRRIDRKLSFSHAAHTGRVKQCGTCHPKAEKASVPGHAACNTSGCHARTFAALRCRQCHEDMQRYREKTIAELKHGPGWKSSHGTLARQATEACVQCHDQTYCAECHAAGTAPARASILFPEQIQRGFIHRGSFLARHAVEARSAPHTCRKCHGQRGCRSCHALNGLAESVHDKLAGARTRSAYHTAGWMKSGSTDFHGHRARQDIARCASCHDRGGQSNCVGCHRVGGLGGNPHPPGWGWRDKAGQCRNNSMCATCHAGGQGCPP